MPGYPLTRDPLEKRSEPRQKVDEYYSIEFRFGEINRSYRFKVWDKATCSLSFVADHDSDILPHLKRGGRVHMKYYDTDLEKPSEYLETVIRHITLKDQGKLKGKYLVGLEILSVN